MLKELEVCSWCTINGDQGSLSLKSLWCCGHMEIFLSALPVWMSSKPLLSAWKGSWEFQSKVLEGMFQTLKEICIAKLKHIGKDTVIKCNYTTWKT